MRESLSIYLRVRASVSVCVDVHNMHACFFLCLKAFVHACSHLCVSVRMLCVSCLLFKMGESVKLKCDLKIFVSKLNFTKQCVDRKHP